jgi:acetyl esterase/lipase
MWLRSRPKALAIAERRLAYDALGERFPVAGDVDADALVLGGVPAESTVTPAFRSGTVLYLHGGGYVFGSLKSHRHLASEIGRAAGARSVALDYRRAPEAPFPAALEDAVTAWRSLLALGNEPRRLALAGDSAGGGLAVAMMVRLRELGLPQPVCCVVLSPWVDLLAQGDSYRSNAARDPVLGRGIIEFCARQYIGEGLVDHPLASPVRADLRGIAPLAIFAGSTEALLDDAVQLARQAGLADVPVRLEVWPGMFHIWPTYHQVLPEGRRALASIGAIVRSAFDA